MKTFFVYPVSHLSIHPSCFRYDRYIRITTGKVSAKVPEGYVRAGPLLFQGGYEVSYDRTIRIALTIKSKLIDDDPIVGVYFYDSIVITCDGRYSVLQFLAWKIAIQGFSLSLLCFSLSTVTVRCYLLSLSLS